MSVALPTVSQLVVPGVALFAVCAVPSSIACAFRCYLCLLRSLRLSLLRVPLAFPAPFAVTSASCVPCAFPCYVCLLRSLRLSLLHVPLAFPPPFAVPLVPPALSAVFPVSCIFCVSAHSYVLSLLALPNAFLLAASTLFHCHFPLQLCSLSNRWPFYSFAFSPCLLSSLRSALLALPAVFALGAVSCICSFDRVACRRSAICPLLCAK